MMATRIEASCRLHFGLLSLPSADGATVTPEPAHAAVAARHFGGVGLMVREPGLRLAVRPADAWSAVGPLGQRALACAHTVSSALAAHFQAAPPGPFRIEVEQAPPEHHGLGSGTQLALAITRALAANTDRDPVALDPATLARLAGRGARSALGTHGFVHGGFLVEGGKAPAANAPATLAPLIARHAFPDDWHIALIMPRGPAGLHGVNESQVFAQLGQASDLRVTESLCRLVLLGMLPALVERDLPAFGEALFDFNRRVGEIFRPWQGGVYSHPQAEAIVQFLREQGIAAVGQSSWGPALFAIAEPDRAAALAQSLRTRFQLAADEVRITQADNQGARVTPE